MRKEIVNWDLEAFIKTRAFTELNQNQQQWVLQKTTLADYEEQRWALLASQDFFKADALPAPPSLESILQKHQTKIHQRPPKQSAFFDWLQNLTSWRVPAWQLGMAILCGWLLGQWNIGEKNSNLSLVPQLVYQTDTIVREIPVYIGLGKQKWAVFTDSQKQEKVKSPANKIRRRNDSPAALPKATIVGDRELLDFAVGVK